mgnify:CR=1 FL=1
MKLTNKGRYAVMAMADLASNADRGPISLSEISLRQNISLAYLEQIFIKLKNNRLVKSSRGANGGYILDRPASEISIGNVLLRLFQTAQRFDMEVLPQMLLLQKTLVSVEGIGRQLDPKLDLWTAAQPAVNEFISKRISVLEVIRNAKSELPSWLGRIPNLPNQTLELIDRLRSGRLALRTQDPELKNIKEAVNALKKTMLFMMSGFCLILTSCQESTENQTPNVLIIIADDLGWSQIGCYGSNFYETPNIDELSKSGIRFSNAYSAASICSPTRAAIMTGKYPARIDLTDFIPGNFPKNKPLLSPENWQKFLPLDEVTIGEKMEEYGYSTGFFGKWHLSKEKLPPKSLSHNPSKQGFRETFVTYKPSGKLIQKWQIENKDFHNVDTITKRGLKFIEQNKKGPFLLILSHNTIHDPLLEDHELIRKYQI